MTQASALMARRAAYRIGQRQKKEGGLRMKAFAADVCYVCGEMLLRPRHYRPADLCGTCASLSQSARDDLRARRLFHTV